MPDIVSSPDRWDIETEVVVVGAGACGITAGLRAFEAGADVIVLERDAAPAGSTALSSGFVPAAETHTQQSAGIGDDRATFAADIQNKAKGRAHPGIVRTAVDNIAPAIDWYGHNHDIPWLVLDDFLYPGHSNHRMHAVPEMTGAGLMARLETAANLAGLDIVTSARVIALCVSAGAVEGIIAERPDGRRETIGCRSVILACNGYGGNAELVERHIPEISAAPYFGHPGNTGDAVIWGEKLHAQTQDLTAYQGHGSLAHPHAILITWALMMEGGIQVNSSGQRFANEHNGYSEHAVEVLQQPGSIAWAVFDGRLHELGMGFPDYCSAVRAGAVHSGALAEIAGRIGVDNAVLKDTIEQTRRFASGARDPFGRDFSTKPALGDDLFAIRVTGALFHTQGGLVIDAQTRVVRADGSSFDNLFAAGGAACGVSGPDVDGYLSGNGLLTAISLGYVAGAAAAGVEPVA